MIFPVFVACAIVIPQCVFDLADVIVWKLQRRTIHRLWKKPLRPNRMSERAFQIRCKTHQRIKWRQKRYREGIASALSFLTLFYIFVDYMVSP